MHININKSGQDNAVWKLSSEDIETMELEDAKRYALWCEDLEADYENEIDDLCSDKASVHNKLDMLQERCRALEAANKMFVFWSSILIVTVAIVATVFLVYPLAALAITVALIVWWLLAMI